MNVLDHYENLLAEHYSWIFGGLNENVAKNQEFFSKHLIVPAGSGIAIDLGAGSGFQSIPLARSGFTVTAIDVCGKLLKELHENCKGIEITIKQGDLTRFTEDIQDNAELIVCMGDTLAHLNSTDDVIRLFRDIHATLEKDGRFILSFRDMAGELTGLDRFIPVRMGKDRLFTCFLEYERESVSVHDLIYIRNENTWELKKSVYTKLRLSKDWVQDRLSATGFNTEFSESINGMVTMIVRI